MKYFVYKLLSHEGRLLHGIIKRPHDNPQSARTYLQQRFDAPVISLWCMPLLVQETYVLLVRFFRKPLKTSDIAEFLRNLAVMLRSGIPVMSALENSVGDANDSPLKDVAEDMFLSIEMGHSLSEAMDRHHDIFPDMILFLVRIGEESGQVDRTLMDASKHLDRLRGMQRDTKSALIYPAFVFTSIFLAAAFWLVYVVPGMSDLFQSMGASLPTITTTLIDISKFLQHYLMVVLASLTGLVLFMAYMIRNHYKTRLLWHRILMRMPITKGLVRSSSQAYLSEYLSLLIKSGVDIISSLRILEQAMVHEDYKLKVLHIRDEVIKGNSLEHAFRHAKIFPGFVVRMIAVGEQSGTLTEQLDYIANEYRARLDHAVKSLAETLKPTVIIVAGAIFGVIIGGLFLPVYQLIGQVGGLR